MMIKKETILFITTHTQFQHVDSQIKVNMTTKEWPVFETPIPTNLQHVLGYSKNKKDKRMIKCHPSHQICFVMYLFRLLLL